MIHKLDLQLTSMLDPSYGTPNPPYTDEEVSDFVQHQIWPAFFQEFKEGQEFTKYEFTQALNDTVAREMARRFGVAGKIKGGISWPGAYLIFRISEVIGDLIAIKHPCLSPKIKPAAATTPQPTDAETFEALKEQVRREIDDPLTSSRDIEARKRDDPQYKAAFDAVQTEAVNKGYGVDSNAQAKPEASGEVKQFAFLFNDHNLVYGVPKKNAGFFVLQSNGRRYEYPVSRFEALMNQAVDAGLIR